MIGQATPSKGTLTPIRHFKETFIAVPVTNLIQVQTVGGSLMSEANQENWCSKIESLDSSQTKADAMDVFLINCMPSNVLALQNRGMRRFHRLPEG